MTGTAPLISIPAAPIPPHGGAEWVKGAGGLMLRAALFRPEGVAQGPARGSVILSPGRTEVIEKYFEVITELQARGFCVLVHDWRGQGLSGRMLKDRLRGHARGWKPFLKDLDALLVHFEARLPRPWIALGHSMGGGLTTLALAEGEARFDAVVLSAPMLGINTGGRAPSALLRLAGLMRAAGRGGEPVAPTPSPFDETFETNNVTLDHARWARAQAQIAACPDLALGGVTWGWLGFALSLAARVRTSRRMRSLAIPYVVVAAGDERLCLNAAAKAAAGSAPQGQYHEIEGALHELLMERDPIRARFWALFDGVADAVAGRGQG